MRSRFFSEQNIPVEAMRNRNELIGNTKDDNSKYCLAKEGEVYLVYLPEGGESEIKTFGRKLYHRLVQPT